MCVSSQVVRRAYAAAPVCNRKTKNAVKKRWGTTGTGGRLFLFSAWSRAMVYLLCVFIFLGAILRSSLGEARSTRKLLTLGLISDSHYDAFPAGEKAPWEKMDHWFEGQRSRVTTSTDRRHDIAKDKMDEAITFFNRVPNMSVVVNLGDLVNNNLMWNLKPILDVFHRTRVPHYSILGNHDLRAHNDRFGDTNKTQRAWLKKKLGLRRWYYSIDHPPFRLVFLNSIIMNRGNEHREAGDRQELWLKETLDEARDAGYVVILFAHILIGFETNPLGKFLKEYRHIPLMFFGHNHHGGYEVQGPHRVHCVTLPAQVMTLINAFAVVEIFEDRAEITGFGRVPSRILSFEEPVIELLQTYQGPLTHNLTSQGCQPPPPEQLWANEVLRKPPNIFLNIPFYRKPLLRAAVASVPPRTQFYIENRLSLPRDNIPLPRTPVETVDLTSATHKRTLLVNGVTIFEEGMTSFLSNRGVHLEGADEASLNAFADKDLTNMYSIAVQLFASVMMVHLLMMMRRRRLKRREVG